MAISRRTVLVCAGARAVMALVGMVWLITGAFVAMPAAANTDGRIRVDLARGTGPAVTGWGFDIKQSGKAGGSRLMRA
ncbi:hypothetical protein EDD27_4588 [Nonomuraea polychroma]|uniref:Uncharacterized protein n=2 Tax=Nonomuraea polychroma TaxID=46176 RepID=A0A438M8D3_9ACTN|nr:hypothetical protein EDD27_4588 [Nonomuraea polychroma]